MINFKRKRERQHQTKAKGKKGKERAYFDLCFDHSQNYKLLQSTVPLLSVDLDHQILECFEKEKNSGSPICFSGC